MRRMILFLAILIPSLLGTLSAAGCSSATPLIGTYIGADGPAEYVVSMPSPSSCYNGEMILFAHGFVAPGSPANTWMSQLVLPDGTSLPALANSLGFGFAASSFSKDGLATQEGVQDTFGLVNVLQGNGISVREYFVTGASEGGLIAVKALETNPIYSGGLSVCGPIGSFQDEIDYLDNVRVLFDYFFPGILKTGTPGESAISIPSTLQLNWSTVYEPSVLKALAANPLATLQLVSVARIPIGLNLSNAAGAITEALWYNVFGANDTKATLQGNAFDNHARTYTGSLDDRRLNARVARFTADPVNLAPYNTTGIIHDPLVTLHTIEDPIVPFGQEALYTVKVAINHDSSELAQIPVFSYGHCNVTGSQAGTALALLLLKAAN